MQNKKFNKKKIWHLSFFLTFITFWFSNLFLLNFFWLEFLFILFYLNFLPVSNLFNFFSRIGIVYYFKNFFQILKIMSDVIINL